MAKTITQKLGSAINNIARHKDMASCTAEERASYHISTLGELIDLLIEAKAEIEKLQSAQK
ncbi:TPA: hypothetical protein VEO38_003545 [Providencia alcalifaciens]|nr:hypothetical protein [Providencia alcalifaciens]